jgi:hypothetical protein
MFPFIQIPTDGNPPFGVPRRRVEIQRENSQRSIKNLETKSEPTDLPRDLYLKMEAH